MKKCVLKKKKILSLKKALRLPYMLYEYLRTNIHRYFVTDFSIKFSLFFTHLITK